MIIGKPVQKDYWTIKPLTPLTPPLKPVVVKPAPVTQSTRVAPLGTLQPGNNQPQNTNNSGGFAGAGGGLSSAAPGAGVTSLQIYNASNAAVNIEVTTQSPGPIVQAGCTTQASDLRVTDTQTGVAITPTQYGPVENGTFSVASGHTVTVTSILGPCLQGIVFFFGSPGQCACGPNTPIPNCAGFTPFVQGPAQPNGVNQGEASLNLPTSNEAIDISCVQGANSALQMVVTAPAGGPFWFLGNDPTPITTTITTQNSWVNIAGKVDNNCVSTATNQPIPGIFPFGCTDCINSPSPPCGAPFCVPAWGSNPGCQYNRAPLAGQQFGGIVQFNYLGPIAPPN